MTLSAPAPVAPRPLPRSRLEHLVPSLCAEQALVALVPATGDMRWAAEAAWDVARAAAAGGIRRVALVDLWLEEPLLHEVAGLRPSDGIVDAFEYGVSLTKAAHPVDGVYFIAGGSYTAHPGDVLGHARWPKLHAGFRAEGALLLLFLSAAALARLSAVPDGVIVLAPAGCDPGSAAGRDITAALERGAPLLGVVRERWTPATPPPAPRGRRVRPGVAALALVIGGVGAYALRALPSEGPAAPAEDPRAIAPPPSQPRADSVPWTVQLAAYGALEKALEHADDLAEREVKAFVTPVVLGGSGALWYRVLAGAYRTQDSAAAGREALWRREIAPRGEGDLLHAPFSLRVADPADAAALRRLGVPGVRWGADHVLVGAFETPEQAAPAGAQLERAGLRFTLITRLGTLP